MPVPSPRNPILPARGNYVDLLANVGALSDGEICYAIDQDTIYMKEGNVLVPTSGVTTVNNFTGNVVLDADDIDDTSTAHKFATSVQLGLADTSVQPGDNVTDLTNDAGYLTSADIVNFGVSSFNTRTGAVTLTNTDVFDAAATGGTFTGNVSFSSLDIGGIGFSGTGTGNYTLPSATPTSSSYLNSESDGTLSWVSTSSLADQTGVVSFANVYANDVTIAGHTPPSYLTHGRGWHHASPSPGNIDGWAYINAAGDAHIWGIDDEYFWGTGYTAAVGSYVKKKLNIPYQDVYNRKAWLGDPDYAHLKTNIEGVPLEKFEDMAKVRQVELGYEGISVLTENGRVYTCGYAGYGTPGQETTTAVTNYLKPIRLWTAAGGALLDGPNFPKIKQLYRSDAGKGYDYNSYSQMFALDTDGNVYSCGYNALGQLGTNNVTAYSYLQRLDPSAFNNEAVVFITGSGSYYNQMYAITETGKCFVWGPVTYGIQNTSNAAFTALSEKTPTEVTANPLNSVFGKEVLHVATASDDYYQQAWFICSDGTVHWWGYQAAVAYRTCGLMTSDIQNWLDTDPSGLGVRASHYGSSTATTPPANWKPLATIQLDSAAERINSNGQKVVAAWTSAHGLATCYFLTDGGNDGPSGRKLYMTESYGTYSYKSSATTGPDGRQDEDYNEGFASEPGSRAIKECLFAWVQGERFDDGNGVDNRYARLHTTQRQENIDAGLPTCLFCNGYYSSGADACYMTDDKGYVWYQGYEGASYGSNGWILNSGATGGTMTPVYNWARIRNLSKPMKYVWRIDNMATASNYAVVAGCDYDGNLWGGHAAGIYPNYWLSPIGVANPYGTNVPVNSGEIPWTICSKF